MFSDFLRDSPVYQEVLEEGLEKGLEKGVRVGELRAQRRTLLDIVQERFPAIAYLVREQAEATDDPEILRHVAVKISIAQTVKEAEQYLLAITRDDKKN